MSVNCGLDEIGDAGEGIATVSFVEVPAPAFGGQ